MNDNPKPAVLDQLTDLEIKVACILHILASESWSYDYGYCYFGHNSILTGEGRISSIDKEVGGRRGLSKTLKHLRELGVVKFARGLFNEDGEVAGSGHSPDEYYQPFLQEICEAKGWLDKDDY